MKFTVPILALYLLLLNFMPCMDREVKIGVFGDLNAFITSASADTLPDEAVPLPCTPFCYNDGGQVLIASIVSFFTAPPDLSPTEFILKNTFGTRQPDLSSRLFALGIFHPPQ